jgi:hypothetical protein
MTPTSEAMSLNNVQFTCHHCPFQTLPTLKLYAQPHFAIYNFSVKAVRAAILDIVDIVAEMLSISNPEALYLVATMQHLYVSWTNRQPPPSFNLTSYVHPCQPSTSGSEDNGDHDH